MNNTFSSKFTEEERELTFIIGALQSIGGKKQLFINMHLCVRIAGGGAGEEFLIIQNLSVNWLD